MEKKKIAFVIGTLSTSGGAERVITTLSNELIDNYHVNIITLKGKDSFYKLKPKIKIHACLEEIKRPNNIFQSLSLNYKLFRNLIRILKLEKIELVIGFITMTNVLSIIASKFIKIRCIVSERNHPEKDSTSKFWKICRRLTYPFADKIIVQTDEVKNYYDAKINSEKIVVLPNPISKDLSKKRLFNKKRENYILNVGRLHKQKNQELLIRAFSKIEHKDWCLKIIGEGEEEENLNYIINKLNLADKVEILKKKTNIHDFYNTAGIFAFTSNYEGFPNALIEALHFGVPSISTDCPTGPSKLIKNGINGYLTPVDNQKEFESYLQKMLDNNELRNKISSNSLKTTEKFEVGKVAKKWMEILETI